MGYIGKELLSSFTPTVKDSFNGDNSTTAFTLSKAVNLATDIEVFVDNIQQEPGSSKSYTVSGTTLTFNEAPPTGTGNVYVIHRNSLNGTLLPPQDLGSKNYNITGNLSLDKDSAALNFGADSEITLTHSADAGLILKHATAGNDKFPTLTLQTGDTDIAVDNVLGRIAFQAPDEGTGTDAILVAAGIEAVSEGDFSSSSNATKLSFKTGASETATAKMNLTSAGKLEILSGGIDVEGGAVFNEDSADVDFRVESNGNTHMLFVDGGSDAVTIGTSTVDTNATMTVSNTGDNHGISIVGALNKSRMHFQGANTGSASTDGLVIGLSSSDDTNDDSALFGLKESGSMTFQTAGTNHMIIDGTGAVTKPLQPGFLVRNSSDQSNISLATLTTVVFDTEVFDNNADFASNTFTAPVTGRYLFTYNVNFAQVDADHTVVQLTLATSNNTFTNNPAVDPSSFDSDMDIMALNGAIICDMDANDTAFVRMSVEGGSAQLDIKANGVRTNFGGYLLG